MLRCGQRRSRWRVVLALVPGLLFAAIVVVGLGAIGPTSARVAATTASTGLPEAGVIALDRAADTRSILIDADNLVPGQEASGCLVVEYSGDVPVHLRLYGESTGGTGLDAYLVVDVTVEAGGHCDRPAAAGVASAHVRDRLASFGARHGDHEHGLPLAEPVDPGEQVAVRVRASVVDDNRAQGLTSDFVLVLDARPA